MTNTARRLALPGMAAVLFAATLVPPPPAEATPPDSTARVAAALEQGTSERNAALAYWRDWAVMGDDLQTIATAFNEDPAWTPDEETTGKLEIDSETISSLVRTTRTPLCDFQPALEEGAGALLPHVAKLRQTALALAADARRLTELGDFDDAGERVEAIVRLAGHASSDRVLISSLVGAAVLKMGEVELERLAALDGLTDAARRHILAALDEAEGLAGDDLLRFKAAIGMERHVFLDSLVKDIHGPDADSILGTLGLSMIKASTLKAMTAGALAADVNRARDMYDEALAAWDQPDAREKLGEIEDRLERGEYGLTASVMGPVLTRLYDTHEKARAARDGIRRVVTSTQPSEKPADR